MESLSSLEINKGCRIAPPPLLRTPKTPGMNRVKFFSLKIRLNLLFLEHQPFHFI